MEGLPSMEFRPAQQQIDLDGQWWFAYQQTPDVTSYASSRALQEGGLRPLPCTVPGNLELDLQAAGLLPEPFFGMNILKAQELETAHVWYWRAFDAEPLAGHNAELVLEGIDCYADVYLNGQLLGSCDNMLVEQVFPVDGLLERHNELFVHIKPALEQARQYPYAAAQAALTFNYESLYVRQAPHMYGWDIMPRALSAGLWRPVRLRFRPLERLDEVYLQTLSLAPDYRSAELSLYYRARTNGSKQDLYEIAVTGECGESRFEQRQRIAFDVGHCRLSVPRPKLWWPRGRGEANLYSVTVSLLKNGALVDSLHLQHGIRTIDLLRTSTTSQEAPGQFEFRVNGERLFILGTNWVPLDAFHSRDIARVERVVALAKELGVNAFRCWGGNVYESDRFFSLCDQAGILVWQDFAMACAVYPQEAEFCARLADEARRVVKRLRQHACLALWAGDNECDVAHAWRRRPTDPNENVLTRRVLPEVLRQEDPDRPYLPSSPYVDSAAYQAGQRFLPENHLWGPRDYYKSDFYRQSLCLFASEIGYHGCPSPESVARFISPDKLWPPLDNPEWMLHCTSPVPDYEGYNYRVELMLKQVRELFGTVPDNLTDFSFASQVSQAEAKKFFIELFRSSKWNRTGIIWWNLMDGWPQFSDAVVDYYFSRKLAFDYIRRAQQPLCLVLREPSNWGHDLVACNDTRQDLEFDYVVRDVATDEVVAQGHGLAEGDAVTALGRVPFSMGKRRFYVLEWTSPLGQGRSHYLAGNPPFDLEQYRGWMRKAGLL